MICEIEKEQRRFFFQGLLYPLERFVVVARNAVYQKKISLSPEAIRGLGLIQKLSEEPGGIFGIFFNCVCQGR